MKKIIITGSLGLVGSSAVQYYINEGWEVHGVDNDMRKHFFGESASVVSNKIDHKNYYHYGLDISKIEGLIQYEKPDAIIHAAAQPSHDYSATNPLLDFGINAYSTLMLLEFTRQHAPEAVFIYVSTNKVYGDWPNTFEYEEQATRYDKKEPFNEMLPLDNCAHSPFGVSKLTGDLYAQEYARYYGLKTGIFRCGCITGKAHKGTELHGFLAYMARCKKLKKTYKIYGYNGKQVRDNIHASDLVSAFDHFIKSPKPGEVYNIGGGLHSNISVIEARNMMRLDQWEYIDTPRVGDHIWWISDVSKFKKDYPEWDYKHTMWSIAEELLQ